MTKQGKSKGRSLIKSMKKTLILLSFSILLTGCANKKSQVELLVGAAASLEPAMKELQVIYTEQNPETTIHFTFAGSGAIEQQIREGAPVDIFISAAEKQIASLAKDGLIIEDTKVNLLSNEVVLVVPKDSALGISSFENILNASVIAIGDPESVPAGQYAKEVFDSMGIWEDVNAKTTLGKDVTEVLAWVSSGNADAGVVYATDAITNNKVSVIASAPAGSHSQIIYPAVVLKDTKAEDRAKDFIAFLESDEAGKIFEKFGFVIE